jgi:N-formylglutamate deformylase
MFSPANLFKMGSSDKTISAITVLAAKGSPRPVVFDCPHAGRTYPADFNFTCPQGLLERAEDRYVDRLLDWAPKAGIPLLLANFPRTYIDVNRALDEVDLALIADDWPLDSRVTDMTAAGIGLVRRLLTPTLPLYDDKLPASAIIRRIDTCYVPYHAALNGLIHDAQTRFGSVLHINWHSMPSRFANGQRMPDFVLGNRAGRTADPALLHAGRAFLQQAGWSVHLNDPYPGQEIIRRTGDPHNGVHAIQIEINRALYLDEGRNELHAGHTRISKALEELSAHLETQLLLPSVPLAAD